MNLVSFKKDALYLLVLCTSTLAYAGTPVWTLTPDANYPPITTVSANDTATVKYTVTNQSVKPHLLVMTPILGITSTVTDCATGCLKSVNALCLPTKGSRCMLTLTVNGSQLQGNVTTGPELCQQGGNMLQCYTPATPLTITLSGSGKHQPTITVLPTTLALTEGSTARSVTVTNQSLDTAIDNLSIQISPDSEVTIGNQSTCASTLTAGSTCTYYFLPGNKNETVTATIVGSNTAASVLVTIMVGPAASTTLSTPTTGIIPVNDGQGSLIITNTGSNTAYNVHAVLPADWTSATHDATNCLTIAPSGGTCMLYFSSTTPYVAQSGILITGDNIITPPTTALAFQMNSGLVFSADGSTAKVITMSDINSSSGIAWDKDTSFAITNAQSLTNGRYNDQTGNTYLITNVYGLPNNPATYAAALCYNYTGGLANAGDWYLPAICELGNMGISGTPCNGLDNIANIYSNLYKLGFIQDIKNGGEYNYPGLYWSSTEVSGDNSSPYGAWLQDFGDGAQRDGNMFAPNKYAHLGVRCVWAFSY